jgi:hypothetical protein
MGPSVRAGRCIPLSDRAVAVIELTSDEAIASREIAHPVRQSQRGFREPNAFSLVTMNMLDPRSARGMAYPPQDDDEVAQLNPDRVSHEGRHYERRLVDEPVEFVATSGARHCGICRNISIDGMHIDTAEPASVGSDVIVFMRLPGIEELAALPGVVRWSAPHSFGIQLGLYGASISDAIIRMLAGA